MLFLSSGLLTSEGEQHKRQRRILTPAFSPANLKSITPIFWDKASEVCYFISRDAPHSVFPYTP